jgi:ATP-binding cassette subfamily B protein
MSPSSRPAGGRHRGRSWGTRLRFVATELVTRPRTSGRWVAVRTLIRTSRRLALLLATSMALGALVPILLILAIGRLVGDVPAATADGLSSAAGQRLQGSLALVGGAYALSVVMAPWQRTLAAVIKVRLTYVLQRRLMAAVSGPPGIAHLEDPRVHDELLLAQGSLTNYDPADAPATYAASLAGRATGVFACVVIGAFRWWLGLGILLTWLVVRLVLLLAIARTVRAFAGRANALRQAEYYSSLATRAYAAKEVRVFGLGSWLVERFRTSWLAAIKQAWGIHGKLNSTMLRATAFLLAVNLGAAWVIAAAALDHEIDLQQMATLLMMLATTGAVGAITLDEISLEWMINAFPHTEELVAKLSIESGSQYRSPAAPPAREIRFEDVAFRYPGATSAVFTDLNLTLRVGESVAIVGVNGAGKTTLVKLLCGLHPPTAGRVTVDGVDLASLDPTTWRRHVAVVFQDYTRYPLTVAECIGFGAPNRLGDRTGLEVAAERAGALTLIEHLPHGWDTVLSADLSGGVDLSGGEWQRIALARALFATGHGARLLVLDEPTAALDVRGEAQLFERLLDATEGLTTILISHRFSTIRAAGRIVVLGDRGLREQGDHAGLLAAGGVYAQMYALQAARFASAEGSQVAVETPGTGT